MSQLSLCYVNMHTICEAIYAVAFVNVRDYLIFIMYVAVAAGRYASEHKTPL